MRLFRLLVLVLIINLSGCISYVAHSHRNGKYDAEIFGGTRLYFEIIVEAWNNTPLSDIWDISLLLGLLDFPFSFITDILLLPYDSILNFIEVWKDFYN